MQLGYILFYSDIEKFQSSPLSRALRGEYKGVDAYKPPTI
jgi:hypothetical protein